MVWFYGIFTIVGYLMPNLVYTYILDIYGLVWFYGISTSVGACGVMVIVTGYGHGDTSSIPGQDWLHFT